MKKHYRWVAWEFRISERKVKKAVEGVLALAAEQTKKTGSFKLAGMLNFKLKDRPATKARKWRNPCTKERCIIKAKPASKTVKVTALHKMKKLLHCRIVYCEGVCEHCNGTRSAYERALLKSAG